MAILHSKKEVWRTLRPIALVAATIVSGTLGLAMGAHAQTPGGFADPAFKQVWERTDQPVALGRTARTWVWGPVPGRSLQEPFKEGPGGMHLVQYFDKARMEINNPTGNVSDPYYVTNGLLVVEMINGRIQTGVNQFESVGASDKRIAGDDGSDAPTYAALQRVASVGVTLGDNRADRLQAGSVMPQVYINSGGYLSAALPAQVPKSEVIRAATYIVETGHNIPDLFWNYLNSQGLVYENGAYVNGTITNWVSAFGFPITEPYWTSISVGGRWRPILFQAFQRRILTYSPSNDPAWRVEMGNVGLQYYSWRYETQPLSCQRVPVRGFGKVWAEHRGVQRGIGCPFTYPPFDREAAVESIYQPFEHGMMLEITRTIYTQERIIYVFFDDGSFRQFSDTWVAGDPVSGGLTPPSGRYEPVRGLGKVWREGTGAQVRERLGWALAPEKAAPGAYQRFDKGEMYWSGAADKIWVLYGTGTPYPGSEANFRYEVYDDTFDP
ncbi:MAG TPA: hypothetical protein VJ183_12030 [Chloroflexia bacterium]|nr:hypothetical protein [Chloroflexia bacterium]